jgi:hypothetical protein
MHRLALIALAAAVGLGGCKTVPSKPLEASVRTVEVKVAVPVPCRALETLGPEPAYPDTDAAIAAATGIGQLAALYAKGRAMRVQRLLEYSVAKAACTF